MSLNYTPYGENLQQASNVEVSSDIMGHRRDEYDAEHMKETFITAALEEVARLMMDIAMRTDEERDTEVDINLDRLTDPERVQNVYITAEPWRCPLVVVEIEDCPDWLNMSGSTSLADSTEIREFPVQTDPARASDTTGARFQIRHA